MKPEELERLIETVADGRWDDLRPEEVAALEERLNEDPLAASRLEVVVPVLERGLCPVPAEPGRADWNAAWDRIAEQSAGGGHARQRSGRTGRRMLRVWEPLCAVAACVLLMVAWWKLPGPKPVNGWELKLSNHVEVNEIEVYADLTPLVVYTQGATGAEVVWMLDEEGV